jgi:mycoredoxin
MSTIDDSPSAGPPTPLIRVYATQWCGDCRRARAAFDKKNVPYVWIDIDTDDDAERFVVEVNHGLRSVPTIIFPDGSILVEPNLSQLLAKLAAETPG